MRRNATNASAKGNVMSENGKGWDGGGIRLLMSSDTACRVPTVLNHFLGILLIY